MVRPVEPLIPQRTLPPYTYACIVERCPYCGRQPSGQHLSCEGCGAPVKVHDRNGVVDVTTLADARRVLIDVRTGRRVNE